MLIEQDNGPLTYIKESPIEGTGLFAQTDIEEGDIIIDYRPFKKSFYKIEWKDLRPSQYNKNWLVPVNEQYCLTNDRACKFHYMNHSREPNCRWHIKELYITAQKRIKKDQELLIDYREEYRPNRKKWPEWI